MSADLNRKIQNYIYNCFPKKEIDPNKSNLFYYNFIGTVNKSYIFELYIENKMKNR